MSMPVFKLDKPYFGTDGLLEDYVSVLSVAAYLRKKSANSGLLSRVGLIKKLKDEARAEVASEMEDIFDRNEIDVSFDGERDIIYSKAADSSKGLADAIESLNFLMRKYGAAEIRGIPSEMELSEI